MQKAIPLLILITASCGSPPTNEQMWSGRWNAPTGEVMKALALKHVTGCGEFYQKENTSYAGDYAVACAQMPDGSGRLWWTGYEVFPRTGEVLGPDLTAVGMKFGGSPREWTKDELNEMKPSRHSKKKHR